jgi:hypothetical protein
MELITGLVIISLIFIAEIISFLEIVLSMGSTKGLTGKGLWDMLSQIRKYAYSPLFKVSCLLVKYADHYAQHRILSQ